MSHVAALRSYGVGLGWELSGALAGGTGGSWAWAQAAASSAAKRGRKHPQSLLLEEVVLRKSGDTPRALSPVSLHPTELSVGQKGSRGVSLQRREVREGWGWVSSREGRKTTNEERKRLESHHLCRSDRSQLSREIPALQSKAGGQEELRGSAGLISEGC